MSKREILSISLDKPLFEEFEHVRKALGYGGGRRSKALQQALREWISNHRTEALGSEVIKLSVITIRYDHTRAETTQDLVEAQHSFSHHTKEKTHSHENSSSQHQHFLENERKIFFSSHIHLTQKDCLEIIVLQGKHSDIEAIVKKFQQLDGVKLVQRLDTSVV